MACSDALRPRVMGKFLFVGNQKLYVRGVTYGPFRPGPDGCEYHDLEMVNHDFFQIAANGINAIRTYTVPPHWLLDCAQQYGLRVMVGLPWEQHVAFLQDRKLARQIERRVRDGIRACGAHPALLGYAIGNEIPAGIVRWHGRRCVEKHIERLYHAVMAEDPMGLVTYVNYPSTEYLELPFVDLFCFNVYLESPNNFELYLARLQNLAGDKPLLLTETGLDSYRNGEQKQAEVLDWQIRAAFSAGCAGTFVFNWTDEWHRGGQDIEDWNFGLTRRDRREKPALAAVRRAFAELPFPFESAWPRISVVVCTYNGIATLDDCLAGLHEVEYPNFEVIVVNDGSLNAVAQIAQQFNVRLLNIPRGGLSVARNAGLEAATGEIVAYIDDDTRADPHWLQFLAHTFMTTDYAAVGGPNIPPRNESALAKCVAHSPGGPAHVLVSDRDAEHIPGCNMAFRKSVLETIGGFDPQFRVAGDDVDVCWRVQEAGFEIGFNPGAMVWHHRRQGIRTYWKQQVGYGRAEALLEQKWPQKYNAAGHAAWSGRIYGSGRLYLLSWGRPRIYHGLWGRALFQSLYQPAPSHFWSMARMPEWYLVMGGLAFLAALGTVWRPLYGVFPLLALAVGPWLIQAGLSARQVPIRGVHLRVLVGLLHLLQPLARLYGRLAAGLTPWRRRRVEGFAIPGPRTLTIWSERWRSPHEWLESIEAPLKSGGSTVIRGGDFDRWDLEVRSGPMGAARLRVVIEEHGAGAQLVRARIWPRWLLPGVLSSVTCAVLAFGALRDQAWPAVGIFGGIAAFCFLATLDEWSVATAALLRGVRGLKTTGEIDGIIMDVPATADQEPVQTPQTNP